MRRAKRIVLNGLCFVLCLLLCACSTIPDQQSLTTTRPTTTTTTPRPFAFAMGCIEGDSFHPYKAKNVVNRSYAALLYEGLYALGEDLSPKAVLAASPHTEVNGITPVDRITVTIRDGARFSNGATVTPEDVVASFKLAQKSDRYQLQLSVFRSAKKDGKNAVEFELSDPDVHALSRLTFPIVEKNSADTDTPIGSGLYCLDAKKQRLIVNPRTTATPSLREIPLKSYRNSDALRHALGTGQIALYTDDLADGEVPRISTASATLATPNLVFVGFNSKNANLTPAVRQAINAAIGRTPLCDASFAGYADAAVSPFHPLWQGTAQPTLFAPTQDAVAAMTLLANEGYRTANSDDKQDKKDKSKKELSLSLIVSNGSRFRLAAAKQLCEQLTGVGVKVAVEELDYDAYLKRLKRGNFDLYVGEIRLTDDLDLSPFFANGGNASFGIKGTCSAVYTAYRSGQATLSDFTAAFTAELPFLPLCYRRSLVAYDRHLQNVELTGFHLFSNIQTWTIPSY